MKKNKMTIMGLGMLTLFASSAYADLEQMKARVPDVVRLKDEGCIGETPKGLLGVVKSCPNAKETVDAENRDRLELYKERAAKASELNHDLGKFQEVIGEEKVKREPKGRMVQDATGAWVKKP